VCWSSGEWCHPLAGEGFGESHGVAVGEHDVGVVEEPVDGGGARALGMIVSKPEGWRLEVTTERRS
jgi:hypothetical protein